MSTKKESRNIVDELETLQQVLDDAAGEKVNLERALTQLNTVDDVPLLSDLFGETLPEPDAVLRPITGGKTAAISALKPSQPSSPDGPLDLSPQPQQLTPAEALDAIQNQIDALPADQRTGEDWFEPVESHEADLSLVTPIRAATTPDTPSSETAPDATTEEASTPSAEHQSPEQRPTESSASVDAEPKLSANPFLPQAVLDRLTRERLAAQHSAEEAHRTMQRVSQRNDQQSADAIATLDDVTKNQLIDDLIEEITPHIQSRLREKLRHMLKPHPPTNEDRNA